MEPEQQTAHQLTLVSVRVLSKSKQTCEIKGTPAMEKKRVKNQSDLDCFLFFCTDKLKRDHLLWLIIPAYSCLIYSTLLCLNGYC